MKFGMTVTGNPVRESRSRLYSNRAKHIGFRHWSYDLTLSITLLKTASVKRANSKLQSSIHSDLFIATARRKCAKRLQKNSLLRHEDDGQRIVHTSGGGVFRIMTGPATLE
jgi:hypothetical protein